MSPVLGWLDVRFFDFCFRHDDSKGCFFECIMNVIDYLLLFYKYYVFLGEGISRRCNSVQNCGHQMDLTVFSFFFQCLLIAFLPTTPNTNTKGTLIIRNRERTQNSKGLYVCRKLPKDNNFLTS